MWHIFCARLRHKLAFFVENRSAYEPALMNINLLFSFNAQHKYKSSFQKLRLSVWIGRPVSIRSSNLIWRKWSNCKSRYLLHKNRFESQQLPIELGNTIIIENLTSFFQPPSACDPSLIFSKFHWRMMLPSQWMPLTPIIPGQHEIKCMLLRSMAIWKCRNWTHGTHSNDVDFGISFPLLSTQKPFIGHLLNFRVSKRI